MLYIKIVHANIGVPVVHRKQHAFKLSLYMSYTDTYTDTHIAKIL